MHNNSAHVLRLDSPTEKYLLNTGSRFRIRGNSRIEVTDRIATNGLLSINVARVRIIDQGDIINATQRWCFNFSEAQWQQI